MTKDNDYFEEKIDKVSNDVELIKAINNLKQIYSDRFNKEFNKEDLDSKEFRNWINEIHDDVELEGIMSISIDTLLLLS